MTKVDLNNTNTFKRKERLKSKKIITSLFDKKEGSFFVCKPLTVAFIVTDKNEFTLPKIGFTVSKSKFKLAVDRNYIKRQMRSAYRQNNSLFIEKMKKGSKSFSLMFIYNKRKKSEYLDLEKAMTLLLDKF